MMDDMHPVKLPDDAQVTDHTVPAVSPEWRRHSRTQNVYPNGIEGLAVPWPCATCVEVPFEDMSAGFTVANETLVTRLERERAGGWKPRVRDCEPRPQVPVEGLAEIVGKLRHANAANNASAAGGATSAVVSGEGDVKRWIADAEEQLTSLGGEYRRLRADIERHRVLTACVEHYGSQIRQIKMEDEAEEDYETEECAVRDEERQRRLDGIVAELSARFAEQGFSFHAPRKTGRRPMRFPKKAIDALPVVL